MTSSTTRTLGLLILVTLGGCEDEVRREQCIDTAKFKRHRLLLESVTNVYPRNTEVELQQPTLPAEAVRWDGHIYLPDLDLVLRKIEFDEPIDGKAAICVSETEITNRMYAVYLADTQQVRDDTEVEAAWKKTQTISFGSTGWPSIDAGDKLALWRDGQIPEMREDHPVSLVTIDQAMDFCEWMTKRHRLDGRFRLPTEDEWLFAAYGTSRKHPWGDERKEWTTESTEPVKACPELRTPEGLYGMWSNVSELVLSPWDGYGGNIQDIYSPFITVWLGASYRDENNEIKPRHDNWGYSHSLKSRSVEWGFRVVFAPNSRATRTAHPED